MAYPSKSDQALFDLRQNNRMNRLKDIQKKDCLASSYPSIIQLETTSYCNAECIMCSHYYTRNHYAKHLTPYMINFLEELLPYAEVIVLHGRGEPFLNPDVGKLIAKFVEYKIHVATNTNLSILTDDIFDLLGIAFRELHISCDGCTKETYEYIRKGLSFDKFIVNLKKIHYHYPDLKMIMTTVLMRQNLMEISQMVDFAADYGFSKIVFSLLTPSSIIQNNDDHTEHFPILTDKMFCQASERGYVRGIEVVFPEIKNNFTHDAKAELERLIQPASPQKYNEMISRFERLAIEHPYPIESLPPISEYSGAYSCEGLCDWMFEKTYIDINANVCVCCIYPLFGIGNLLQQGGFMNVWNSVEYQQLRGEFYNGRLPKFCNGCQFIMNHSMKNLTVQIDKDFSKKILMGEQNRQIYRKWAENFE